MFNGYTLYAIDVQPCRKEQKLKLKKAVEKVATTAVLTE
jgi:hypothetical protein